MHKRIREAQNIIKKIEKIIAVWEIKLADGEEATLGDKVQDLLFHLDRLGADRAQFEWTLAC